MKLKHLLALALVAMGSSAWAQSVGDVLTVGGTKYEVKGANLFTNGSFDDGVNGWKATNYTTAAVASNFTITATGGVNDGAYITTNGAGAGSEKTIRQSIAVENGKMYYFSVYTSGKAPSSSNYNYNALFKMTNATTENGVLKAFEWPQGAEKTTSDWNKTEYVFTASFDYVGVRMGWNQSSNFDEFVLCEIDYYFDTKILADEITAAQEQLATYTSGKPYYESLNSAIQTAQAADPKDAASLNAAVQALKDAEAEAAAEAADDQVVQAHASEVTEYNAAMAEMQKIEGLTWNEAPAASGQHWNGTSDKYYDTWSASATTKTYTATISLPAGTYKLRAAGRGQSGTTTFIQVGNGEKTTFNNTGDTGYGIETNGTMNYSMHGTYANNNAGRGWEWRIIEFTLTEEQEVTLKCGYELKAGTWASICQPELFTAASNFAGDDVFNALNEAIAAAEGHTLGFAVGEYAPYANIDVLNYIKDAKAIDPSKNYFAATVNAVTEALNNATWTENTVEMNAVYDGTFTLTTKQEGGYLVPTGWTNLGYNTRVYNQTNKGSNNGVGEAGCLFAKFTTTYGEVEGYEMPLKAGNYTLKFTYGGWNEVGTRDIKVYNSENTATVTPANVTAKNNQAHVSTEAWSTYEGMITIPADGNYILSFYRQSTTSQNQICISGIELYSTDVPASIERATATEKYGTICTPYAATATGATVYSAAINGNEVELTEVGTNLVAGTPYIYQATADAQTFSYASGAIVTEPLANGPLTGVFTATQVPVGSYVMQTLNDAQKFYIVAEGKQPTLSANRAYLTVSNSEAGVKAFSIGTTEETAIKAIDALMSGDAKIYDMNGREQKSLQKGVNIVNGVKVLVK